MLEKRDDEVFFCWQSQYLLAPIGMSILLFGRAGTIKRLSTHSRENHRIKSSSSKHRTQNTDRNVTNDQGLKQLAACAAACKLAAASCTTVAYFYTSRYTKNMFTRSV